jgi:hypothetical protein
MTAIAKAGAFSKYARRTRARSTWLVSSARDREISGKRRCCESELQTVDVAGIAWVYASICIGL